MTNTTQTEETRFKVVEVDGWNRIDNINEYLEVLEVCPVDYLYS